MKIWRPLEATPSNYIDLTFSDSFDSGGDVISDITDEQEDVKPACDLQ